MEEMGKVDKCLPCEISVAGGMIIKEYCRKDCDKISKEFSEGKMSLRQLSQKVKANEEFLDIFKNDGIPLDLTLEKSVIDFNKK